MPLKALSRISTGQNGVGAFILQCKRLDFHYCDWAGSSKGMNDFLTNHLRTFAQNNPQIEITVSPRLAKHPIIRGTYINGREKVICVRNMTRGEIWRKADLLRQASGEKLKRVTKPVMSTKESVRGVWDAYHLKKPFQI